MQCIVFINILPCFELGLLRNSESASSLKLQVGCWTGVPAAIILFAFAANLHAIIQIVPGDVQAGDGR